jgi:hypothetical protein
VWSISRKSVYETNKKAINIIIFLQDNSYLASVSEETLMVWEVEEMESADQLLSLGPPHHTRWSQVGILKDKTRDIVEEMESADQLLSLGPPHHTRWNQVCVTYSGKVGRCSKWNHLISFSLLANLITPGGTRYV